MVKSKARPGMKCRLTCCDRSAFRGSRGLCPAHTLRVSRGWPEEKLSMPFRRRGTRQLDDVAYIIDYWADRYCMPEVKQLAEMFRGFEE